MHATLQHPFRLLWISSALFPVVTFASAVRADIFQWEYINPADPSQGKRQSTTLAPDGMGLNALPGAELADFDLTMAYLVGADLRNAEFTTYHGTCPGNAACFPAFTIASAILTDADFTDSDIRGASFRTLSLNQLYSTASYRTRDLTGIELSSSNLIGGNFADQNLTNAIFFGSTLTDAIFTNAQVTQTYFGKEVVNAGFCGFPPCSSLIVGTGISPAQLYKTADYQAQNLSGINFNLNDLTGANFRGQNLADASFSDATLTGADFTDADIRGANFNKSFMGTGITLPQLYSTASYRAKDLSGIDLRDNSLAGGNFVGQNLTYARLYDAQLTGADFTAADTRGAAMHSLSAVNLIEPFGHINGLDLGNGDLLVVRDFDGFSFPIPIKVDQRLAMGPGGTLRMVFEADAWDSTISFSTGIPVTLGGTLEITFADDVNLATQIGRTFDLFDWTGVNPVGAFAISSPYAWDLSHLHTTGDVTLISIPEPSSLLLLGCALASILAVRHAICLRHRRVLQIAVALFAIVAIAASARADIYQWEYINPADPSQGKQQNSTLAPDGACVDAVPGADLRDRNLTMAYLTGADLMNVLGYVANLTNADLSHANLSNANFAAATLTDADFTRADVRGTGLAKAETFGGGSVNSLYGCCSPTYGTGITLAQLYSTTSYQDHDLSGISLAYNNLTGGNFAGQNLSNAFLGHATLTDADFSQANLSNVVINDAILTDARFGEANLTNANFCRANITGANFAQANLTNAYFVDANLTGANFREANLVNSNFAFYDFTFCLMGGCSEPPPPRYATLADVDLTAADVRGAQVSTAGAITTNLIRPDGRIDDLDLNDGGLLVVRDYDGDHTRTNPFGMPAPVPPIPITVDQYLAMGPGGTLRMVFESDAWDSTISFAPGIPVTLGGALELTFADDVNLTSQVGRSFELFNWTGVEPTGAFTIRSSYTWDLSKLYTTGEVTLIAVPEPACAATVATIGGLILRRRCLYRISLSDSRRSPQLRPHLSAIERKP
jgi:uncharacterized protein YjbI with pentapeptide repeats